MKPVDPNTPAARMGGFFAPWGNCTGPGLVLYWSHKERTRRRESAAPEIVKNGGDPYGSIDCILHRLPVSCGHQPDRKTAPPVHCEMCIRDRRKAAEGYELVAGERRLRACQLAKMTTIPAILCSYADDRTAALGLLENIQRADLNPFEQAQGLRDVMVLWDCTQAEAAKRLGMAQPTFANKLRLLQLTADQRQFVLDNNLTERHARAVLRLPENRRSEALITIAKRRLNARQTDSYIEQLLNSPPKAGHRISMVRDVRIFVNTICLLYTSVDESRRIIDKIKDQVDVLIGVMHMDTEDVYKRQPCSRSSRRRTCRRRAGWCTPR